VALPTGLISLESSATHRTPLRPVVAILLSILLSISTSLSCHEPRAVATSPPHDVMLAGVSLFTAPTFMYDMRPGLERCSSYCQVDVFVLIGGEHGTLFVDYLTTSPLLTSDAGCNIYIDWYHTSPKATHLALVVHHESEDCATPTQRCIQSLLKRRKEKEKKSDCKRWRALIS